VRRDPQRRPLPSSEQAGAHCMRRPHRCLWRAGAMFIGKNFGSGKRAIRAIWSTRLVDHVLIIRAMLLHNLRIKYLNRPAGFLAEFLRPAFVCVLHYFTFWAVNKKMPPGVSLEQFIWGAFLVWFTFSQIYFVLERSHSARVPRFPGVSRMHMRLAICVWSVISNATFTYVSVLLIIFRDNITFPDVPLTALILLITVTLAFGSALLSEAICRVVPFLEVVFHLFPWLIFLSSGIYFSIVYVPQKLAVVDIYNPVLHLVEYERYAFNPGYPIGLVSLWYPAACGISLLLLGLALNRRLRYRVAV
jgi:ABC-type polysaccharide/polyol phosphate export permease